jgi:tetratricopeptide (TPR) repeat protein
MRLGQYETASELLATGEKAQAGDAEEYLKARVEIHLLEERWAEATNLLDQVSSRFPKSAQVYAIRGAMAAASNLEEAVRNLEQAAALAPKDGAIRYVLGVAYFMQKDYSRARVHLEESASLQPGVFAPRLALAGLCMDTSDLAKAEGWVREALAINPASLPARVMQGYIKTALLLLDEVRPLVKKVAREAPANPDVLHLLGTYALADKRPEQAYGYFSRLQAAEPEKTRGLQAMVRVRVRQGKNEDALRLLRDFQRARPDNLSAWLAVGDFLLETGDAAAAAGEFSAIVKRYPVAIWAHSGLAAAQLQLGKLPDAEQSAKRSLELGPNHPRGILVMSNVLSNYGRFKEAIPLLETALQHYPREASVKNNLAYALSETGGDLNRAVSLAMQAVSLSNRNIMIADTLGWVYYRRGLFHPAIDIFKQAVNQEPDNPYWRYHLGLALLRSGDVVGATKHFRMGLERRPQGQLLDDIHKALEQTRGSRG